MLFLAYKSSENFVCREKDSADYAVTGAWSNKAAEEATRYIAVNKVFLHFLLLPERSSSNGFHVS